MTLLTTVAPVDCWLEGLVDTAPAAMAILDPGGVIIYANQSFTAMAPLAVRDKRKGDDVRGRPFADWIAGPDREDVLGQLSKLVMATISAARLEAVRLVDNGGGERAEHRVNLHLQALKDDCGATAAIGVHVFDPGTPQPFDDRHFEAQKMQALGQLAGGIAHDFNNLLTVILGLGDLLMQRFPPTDPSHDDIAEIHHHATRGSHLVRQLLTFARRQPDEPVLISVDESISELTALLARLLGETIALNLDLSAVPGVVRIDRAQFDQVIVNLAVNARDAMPGGGRLTIRSRVLSLSRPTGTAPEVLPPGRYVVIEVTDTGVGIPQEIIANIFEPFFSTKDVGSGAGLGLATVYGIVHRGDGLITVDSTLGAGTTFTIRLPAATAMVPPAIPTAKPGQRRVPCSASTRTATILLVEDELTVRTLVARALRSHGHTVLEAADGESALLLLGDCAARIHLVVSDVVMPGMDGYTLIRLIRQELPAIPVILVSGYAEESLGADIHNDPSIRFMAKPFTLAGLASEVEIALAGLPPHMP